MKLFTNKELSKKIIIAILLVMSFNFISPTISRADFGGVLFSPIAQLLATLGDLIISGLQTYFIGFPEISDNEIPTSDESYQYYIRYSPGIIFSGTVPGLKVNFINASKSDNESYKNIKTHFIGPTSGKEDEYDDYKNGEEFDDVANAKYGFDDNKAITFTTRTGDEWWNTWNDAEDHFITTWVDEKTENRYVAITSTKADTLKDNVQNFLWSIGGVGGLIFKQVRHVIDIIDSPDSSVRVYLVDEREEGSPTDKTSSALTLKPTVATWYKALRAIALVGLLSVLVYVGIRILISSTGQEKAKYKKMIWDWLAAICILFVLQYIMLFITEITQKITNVLNVDIIGSRGEDILMSNLRNKLQNLDTADFSTVFSELIMYVVLVIYTVLFTIQYLKRLLYLAFFTMIAPLIALTYPIDKIKDGQAQAFTMWLREYIFNALLQPMHLLLYYIFVSSAINLVNANPLYAVVAIGFLLPAEKFFRKMFGFDKATSAGQLGAAAGGALVMNAINKMGQRSGKQAAGKTSGGSDNSGGSTPRYIAAPGGAPGGTPGGAPGGAPGGSPGGAPGGAPGGTPGGAPGGTPGGTPGGAPGGTPGGAPGIGRQLWGETINNAVNPTYSRRAGLRNVGGNIFNKKNLKNGAKTLGRMTRRGIIGAAGAATLGTVGLAAGIATGDPSKAFQYAGAGALAGYMGANKVGDTVTNRGSQFGSFVKENYKEGKWGTDELNTKKSIKELRNDHDFNKVCNQLDIPRGERDRLIREFQSNGITKSEDIKKAFNARLKYLSSEDPKTAQNKIIAAQKIRKEAERYGMKKKDIRQSLIDKGVTGSDLTTAMNLIDML